ncbi:HNH endonuclease signature motif containing protein [Streptomyces sp. NPDC001728]|uniref:HNH endonuclease n=1 Tax=Streptomyces sp. NPDC001728 TaxID=3154396 RepID=UPI00332C4EBB
MPQRMRADAKFCSERCNSAAHQGMRKMWRRLGVPKGDVPLVSRSYLADRDGLKCHLCARKLSLVTKRPNPGYASIDHVIPLSVGGTNDLANLRLAHLVCNLRKRAKAMGEQLALIG